jgi:hypothetical protein
MPISTTEEKYTLPPACHFLVETSRIKSPRLACAAWHCAQLSQTNAVSVIDISPQRTGPNDSAAAKPVVFDDPEY